MAFFSKLLPQGLTARLCSGEPDCRVKPYQIEGNDDSNLSLAVFVEDGAIIGVGVTDLDSLDLVANVGETWDNLEEDYQDPGPMSGWQVLRPSDGKTWSFPTLTKMLAGFSEGTFGLKFVGNLDSVESFLLDEDLDDDDDCYMCDGPCGVDGPPLDIPADVDLTASLNDFVDGFIRTPGTEPRGWDAPEFIR